MIDIQITTMAERPGLTGAGIDVGSWPEFMRYNRVSEAFFWQAMQTFPELCLIATAPDGTVVANAEAVALSLGGPGRDSLPSGGWEQAVVWAFADAHHQRTPNTACALNISVDKSMQRKGLSRLMLEALRQAAARAGLGTLIAPVRPTAKDREPHTPMAEYAERQRSDGLPEDPWLRTHIRAGGRIVGVAPASWTIAGSLEEWRAWTGLPFDTNRPVTVPGALSPVLCNLDGNHAVYVEPNVWVQHPRVAGVG